MENVVFMSWLCSACSYSENAREFLDTHLALSQQFASWLPNKFYGLYKAWETQVILSRHVGRVSAKHAFY